MSAEKYELTDEARFRLEEEIERYADARALKDAMVTEESQEMAERACALAWDVVSGHLTRLQTGEYADVEPEPLGFFGDASVRNLI